MSTKRKPAKEVAQNRGKGEFWIDHAEISEDDLPWLAAAEMLTLWNVRVPDGFLAKLGSLWWLDLRGGTGTDLCVAKGCRHLRYLSVNQIRAMADLSLVSSLRTLEYLSLYGLSNVVDLPSLKGLKQLRRAEVGHMKGLSSIGPILDAPSLTELLLHKRVNITESDIARINKHKQLAEFNWLAEDVPRKVWEPVLAQIDKPATRAMDAIEWFRRR